jgi:hypothetical protein
LGISIFITVNDENSSSFKSITIMTGACKDINRADLWIHLAMNVVSAELLASTVRVVRKIHIVIHESFSNLLGVSLAARTLQCKRGHLSQEPN